EIRFARDSQVARKLLTERLRTDAKPALIFSVDFQGTTATNQLASEIVEERPFIQAGYSSDDSFSRMVTVGEFAALAEYQPSRLIRKAVSTAVAAAQGREVPERVELPVEIRDSPSKSGVPKLQASYKSRKSEAAGEQ